MFLAVILWMFVAGRTSPALFVAVPPSAFPAPQAQSATAAPSNKAGAPQSQSANSSTSDKPSTSSRRRRRKTSAQNCSPSKGASTGKPCPAAKVVVKNGGSAEPTVQLKAPTDEQQRTSTEQLNAATEDNLKKIQGRQLAATEQETLDQAKQFIQQSKLAIADGDLGRGHDLAQKARLLADELAKP